MRRREFITVLGGAAAWPLAARAQQTERMRRIGVLLPAAADDPEWQARVGAFQQALALSGWNIGRNVRIEYRWAEGRAERAAEIAVEFVRLKVDVIVAAGTITVLAAKQATSTIPIVFLAAGDPVGSGLVASLARPGGNVTGLSNQSTDLAGKQVELLREVVPGLSRLAILANVGSPISLLDMRMIEAAAGALGLEVVMLEIRRTEDIAPAFAALKKFARMPFLSLPTLS